MKTSKANQRLIIIAFLTSSLINNIIGDSFYPFMLPQIQELKVIRIETPRMSIMTLDRMLGGFLAMGAIGVKIATVIGAPKTSMDYGEIIMYKFIERAPEEIPGWPAMFVDTIPKEIGYVYKFATSLVFEIESILIHGRGGFMSIASVTIMKPDGKKLWKQKYMYWGEKNGRYHTEKEFKNDNYKLLIEEMEYAANITVSAFINEYKNDPKVQKLE